MTSNIMLANALSSSLATAAVSYVSRHPIRLNAATLGAGAVGGLIVSSAEYGARRLLGVPATPFRPTTPAGTAVQVVSHTVTGIVRDALSAYVGATLLGAVGVASLPAATTMAVVAASGSVAATAVGFIMALVGLSMAAAADRAVDATA